MSLRRSFIRFLSSEGCNKFSENSILPVEDQVKAWKVANRKMHWNIGENEFSRTGNVPVLTEEDSTEGFTAVALFYGFGDDGRGNSDPVLSGKTAWEYARKQRKRRIWQSPYVSFDRHDAFRLRPGAPPRPKGFYFAKLRTAEYSRAFTVRQARESFNGTTGLGPEGFQFLCINHSHFPDLMSKRKTPFMALADYDIAPYGFNDFFDVPQLFSSNGVLGLGIGNVDQHYPGFSIPSLRL
ncbi:MAG: hypothetical protein OEW04_00670 [Nitrospirota bacterium]|nr:hypothetical protein [Nitrospirota bacterium]